MLLRATGHVSWRMHGASAAAGVVLTDGDGSRAAEFDHGWGMATEHSPIGTALVSSTGELLRVNRALGAMLGHPTEQLVGLSLNRVTHPEDLDTDASLWDETLVGARAGYRVVKRYVDAHGTTLWGDLSVVYVSSPDADPPYFLCQILDVTQQRNEHDALLAVHDQLQEHVARLVRSNTELHSFAAVVSHDLQTPLAVVQGYLGLISESSGDMSAPQLQDVVARASRANGRMSSLIGALLDFATVDGGSNAKELLDLRGLARSLVHDLQATAPAGVSLELADGPPSMVMGSPPLLRTMLANLLNNAVKFRRPDVDCHVRVSITRRPDRRDLDVTVEDNGPGVPPAERDRVLEPFGRGLSNTIQGHGLGLATAQRIAGWHGGVVRLDGTPLGGLAVHCLLPASEDTT